MNKIVRVTVEDGVVQYVEVPEGVTVIVNDYDIEGCKIANEIKTDADGVCFFESIWEGDIVV